MQIARGMTGWTRRGFLGTSLCAGVGLAVGGRLPAWREPQPPALGFFVVSDTHILAERDAPLQLNGDRLAMTDRLIDRLNTLPGQPLPAELGGGLVAEPRGVLHLGDMVDTGDKLGLDHERMTETEWRAHAGRFGVTGRDGRLRYPVYEVHGNHDTPRGENVTLAGLRARTRLRVGLSAVSADGLHYSWDWNGIHFVALGIVVGANDDDLPVSRYGAYESLAFLREDLETRVGTSGRPIILLQHVDLQRYARPCDDTRRGLSRAMCCEGMARIAWHSRDCPKHAEGISMDEWSACDVAAYWRAVAGYNVAAIFHGHLHARRIDLWDGISVTATDGIPVFGAKNAGAGGASRAFFYCAVEGDLLVVREYQSIGEAGWQDGQSVMRWAPDVWRVPLRRPSSIAARARLRSMPRNTSAWSGQMPYQ